jgi:hypothetical protein
MAGPADPSLDESGDRLHRAGWTFVLFPPRLGSTGRNPPHGRDEFIKAFVGSERHRNLDPLTARYKSRGEIVTGDGNSPGNSERVFGSQPGMRDSRLPKRKQSREQRTGFRAVLRTPWAGRGR